MDRIKGKSVLVDENITEDDAKRAMGIVGCVFDDEAMLILASCEFGGKPGALLGAKTEDGIIPMAILLTG